MFRALRTSERALVLFRTIFRAAKVLTKSIARSPLSASLVIYQFLYTGLTGAGYLKESRSNVRSHHELYPLNLGLGEHDTKVFIF